jgi:hypothetical protein
MKYRTRVSTGTSLSNLALGAMGFGTETEENEAFPILDRFLEAGGNLVDGFEPLPSGHPLWRSPNLLISPHVGGASSAFAPRADQLVREQLDRYLTGGQLLYEVHRSDALKGAATYPNVDLSEVPIAMSSARKSRPDES